MNEKLNRFRNDINGKRIAVIGLGISNLPVIDFLLSCGASVVGRDKKTYDAMKDTADKLTQKGVSLILGDDYLENIDEDMIFKAPGIRPDLPQFNEAVAKGTVLTSEMEVFFELCPAHLFAVTGSDGKTTTTTLVYTLLAKQCEKEGGSRHVYVGGNIGKPLLPEVEAMTEDDYAVLELSSFQLQAMKQSPAVACVTNVTPNHLNWHTGMDEYIEAKKTIFLHQTEFDRLVLNYENEVTRAMASEAPGHVTYFSSKRELVPGNGADAVIFEKDGEICLISASGEEPYPILKTSDIFIPGRHNVENYMTAIAAVRGYVDIDTIGEVARTFGGVEHREEFVCEKDGVKYYNSSIDSSPTRTIAALLAFKQKLIIILGGYDKHIPFEPLCAPLTEHAKGIILTGATGEKIRAALEADDGFMKAGIPMVSEPDFYRAIDEARKMAEPGDIVILSPACASFDAFPNFEVRGRAFKDYVMKF